MTANQALANAMFPDITKTPDDYEALYPPRALPEGARVTRIAPSPTGYLHLGVFFTALVNRLTASATGGVFYFRLEDTDKKREVEGGAADILRGMNEYGLAIDEGFTAPGEVRGDYGPYQQSQRVEIYQAYVKSLVEQGLAYPCFCSRRGRQAAVKTGGRQAAHRVLRALRPLPEPLPRGGAAAGGSRTALCRAAALSRERGKPDRL